MVLNIKYLIVFSLSFTLAFCQKEERNLTKYNAILIEGKMANDFRPFLGKTFGFDLDNLGYKKEGKMLQSDDVAFSLSLISCPLRRKLPTSNVDRFYHPEIQNAILINNNDGNYIAFQSFDDVIVQKILLNRRFKTQILYQKEKCFYLVNNSAFERLTNNIRLNGETGEYLRLIRFDNQLIENGETGFGILIFLSIILIGNTLICYKLLNYGMWTFAYWLISTGVIVYQFFS
ncbi:hypothetical protein QMN07_18505 [Leptospira santarosai]|uniref:hypothetical protein n=1 Tax=Leptospira santarosai TaxID=28183 RepID=UPI0024AF48BC|nr:hypothetical protein [Leptospira santarosai]MDI7219480.1 hypothetical protein [Leptospira santarosai]